MVNTLLYLQNRNEFIYHKNNRLFFQVLGLSEKLIILR